MLGVTRRRFARGLAAGAAGLALGAFGGESRRFTPGASAQAAFDFVAGTPGCGRIALLFNVGASYEPATDMLSTLQGYGVPGTFFIMGWLAEQNPGLVQQIAATGFPVGSHGYLPPELTNRSDDDVAWDLGAAASALQSALGYSPGPWFTPFAGASDDRVRSIAASSGLVTVGWGIDSNDWSPDATADSIYNQVVGGAYDGAIVELHMDAQRSVDSTAGAMPSIIEDLSAQGYTFVTVPDMVAGC